MPLSRAELEALASINIIAVQVKRIADSLEKLIEMQKVR
jgi:hypothetical protein